MTSGKILTEKAVLASLNISMWTARKFDRSATAEVHEKHNAARDTGRYNKRLIPPEALAEITSVASKARDYFYTVSQPWHTEGARIMPVALYMPFTEKMRGFRQELEAAVDALLAVYPKLCEQAPQRMGTLYNPADYPSVDALRDKFGFSVDISPVPSADDFRITLAQDEVDALKQDVETRLNGMLAQSTRDSGARIVEVVGRMAERLREYTPATKKQKASGIFRDTLVENVRELATLLPAFNMSGDPKMAAIIASIQRDLCHHDADTLRSNDKLRAKVADSAASILESVNDYLV